MAAAVNLTAGKLSNEQQALWENITRIGKGLDNETLRKAFEELQVTAVRLSLPLNSKEMEPRIVAQFKFQGKDVSPGWGATLSAAVDTVRSLTDDVLVATGDALNSELAQRVKAGIVVTASAVAEQASAAASVVVAQGQTLVSAASELVAGLGAGAGAGPAAEPNGTAGR